MFLSLLWLIGLRCNQIEHDNCVPVTFPLRQPKRGERKGLREGQGMCVYCIVCAAGQRGAPEAPPFCGSMLHRATEPQRKAWCPADLHRETSPRERTCMWWVENGCVKKDRLKMYLFFYWKQMSDVLSLPGENIWKLGHGNWLLLVHMEHSHLVLNM